MHEASRSTRVRSHPPPISSGGRRELHTQTRSPSGAATLLVSKLLPDLSYTALTTTVLWIFNGPTMRSPPTLL